VNLVLIYFLYFFILLYFSFYFHFFNFELDEGCDVMSHVIVTQAYDTKKDIERIEISDII